MNGYDSVFLEYTGTWRGEGLSVINETKAC